MEIKLRNDYHAHSNKSYCCEQNIDAQKYLEKIKDGTLDTVAITDHSMALYFPSEIAWSWKYMGDSSVFDSHREFGNRRLDERLAELEALSPQGIIPGLETEMMNDGRLTFDPAFRPRIRTLIGSVHFLPVETSSSTEIFNIWKMHTLKLINSGIDVLGHPFRWIENITRVDYKTMLEIIQEAKRADVAIELNGHYIVRTDKAMLYACAETGAKISFGSDSHTLAEAGDLKYHEKLLAEFLEEKGMSMADLRFFEPQRNQGGA